MNQFSKSNKACNAIEIFVVQIQCVLVINIFNEKIFILLWLWFCILFFITLFDGLYWFSVSLFHRDRFRFVLRHLEVIARTTHTFCEYFLAKFPFLQVNIGPGSARAIPQREAKAGGALPDRIFEGKF